MTVAWLGNWMYARQLSVVAPWHGGLIGIPRHLQLTATAAGSRLRQRPIDAVTTLREGAVTESRLALLESTAETSLATHVPIPGDWDVMLELGTASAVTLSLFDGAIAIALERNGALLTLQRASRDGLPATFATRQEALREKPSRAIRLRMLVDTCAIELFADDGATTFSALVFPPRIDAPIRARATAGTARITLSMWALRRTALPPCGAGNIARPL